MSPDILRFNSMSTDFEQSRILNFMSPMLIGAFSGCCSVLVTNPIDVVKTRLQLQGELQKKGLYPKQLNGLMDTLSKTIQHEGIKSLQKGLGPSFGYQIILNGIRLGMYEKLKKIGQSQVEPKYNPLVSVLSGGFLGFVGGFFASPFNLIKTRIMLQSNFLHNGDRYQYLGFSDAIKTIYKKQGYDIKFDFRPKGLFMGSTLWGMRTCLAAAVQLPLFDLSKDFVQDKLGLHGLSGSVIASASSSFVLCVILCPMDGLSTRYQNQQFDSKGKGIIYKNVFSGAKNILQTEGFFGFYKGFSALLARLGPQTFLSLVIFTHLMQSFNF